MFRSKYSRLHFYSLIVFTLLCVSCASETRSSRKLDLTSETSKKTAYEKVVQWLKEQNKYPEGEFDTIGNRDNKDKSWSFLFIKKPMRPGGEFTIIAYDNGKYVFLPGL